MLRAHALIREYVLAPFRRCAAQQVLVLAAKCFYHLKCFKENDMNNECNGHAAEGDYEYYLSECYKMFSTKYS